MKLLTFEEFCKLKDGVIYSRWEYENPVGLFRRGEVIYSEGKPIDFFEASIIASCFEHATPEVDFTESRWAEFDQSQKFLVYDMDDIQKMMGLMSQSMTCPHMDSKPT